MTINFAVDRLYETGWLPSEKMDLERLPNGLRYPAVSAVQRIFKEAGFLLVIKPHLMFGCCRAEWTAVDLAITGVSLVANDESMLQNPLGGTVVGSCDCEAAVFALAKLREQLVDRRLRSEETAAFAAV